jgi:hypothetical protein
VVAVLMRVVKPERESVVVEQPIAGRLKYFFDQVMRLRRAEVRSRFSWTVGSWDAATLH